MDILWHILQKVPQGFKNIRNTFGIFLHQGKYPPKISLRPSLHHFFLQVILGFNDEIGSWENHLHFTWCCFLRTYSQFLHLDLFLFLEYNLFMTLLFDYINFIFIWFAKCFSSFCFDISKIGHFLLLLNIFDFLLLFLSTCNLNSFWFNNFSLIFAFHLVFGTFVYHFQID